MKPTPHLDQGDLFMSKAPWFDIAQKYLGLKEIKGSKHAPLVVKMWSRIKLAGIKDDETPWCAAFVGSCLEEVNIKSSRSAAALSYEKFGQSVGYPVLGAIAYKKRYNSAGKVIGGHVGFVAGQNSKGQIMLLGGNQNDQVCIAPFNKSVILGYRWPNGYPVPARVTLPLVNGGTSPVSEA